MPGNVSKQIILLRLLMGMLTGLGIGPAILMYHSISDDSDEPYSVSVEEFNRQINWLLENDYSVISLSALVEGIKQGSTDQLTKKVVLTFDDGYQDFIENAVPILDDKNLAATVFLVTGMLGGVSSWNPPWDKESLMDVGSIREIIASGIIVGSHTVTHPKLNMLSLNDIKAELKASYDALQGLGQTFCSLAYPYGQWDDRVIDVVKETGYECALAVGERTRFRSDNCFCLPRVTMRREMSIIKFEALMKRTSFEIECRRKYGTLKKMIA